MSPILSPSPRHTPADTASHNPDLSARPVADIASPSPRGRPSSPAGRHHVRGRRSGRQRTATHLPHWKIRPWPHHGLGARHLARRRDHDWMRLRRIKDHAPQCARDRDDAGPRRAPHDLGTVSEADEDDGKPPPPRRSASATAIEWPPKHLPFPCADHERACDPHRSSRWRSCTFETCPTRSTTVFRNWLGKQSARPRPT